MFKLVQTLAILALVCAGTAWADDIPSAPGWSLTRITENTGGDDNTYGEARVYYSLKPPDARPAISIDARTADRLRSGDANAEGVYSGSAGNQKKREDEEFVYGNHGNGIIMADDVNSTLTLEEGRKELPPANPSGAGSGISGLRSAGGLAGFNNGSSGSSRPSHNSAGPQRNTSAASAPPPAPPPSQNTATGGGPAPMIDPREVAAAQAAQIAKGNAGTSTSTSTSTSTAYSGPQFGVFNQAQGFGMNTGTSSNTNTSFVTWPGGDPANSTSTAAHCSQSVAKTFQDSTIQRFSVPEGCGNVRVYAWGAGGGAGGVIDGTGPQGIGGGGAYAYTEGVIDPGTYDIVVVVGGPGGDGKLGGPGGAAGFNGGGKGGSQGGGGGGGFSGLFLIDKAKYNKNEMVVTPELAIVLAAGGGGASVNGENGGPGGDSTGGGVCGATPGAGGIAGGDPGTAGNAGSTFVGGDAGAATGGGGGGAGFFGGGGGGNKGTGASTAGGGGNSFYRFLNSKSTYSAGSGGIAGNPNDNHRSNNAGNAGKPGLVYLEFY